MLPDRNEAEEKLVDQVGFEKRAGQLASAHVEDALAGALAEIAQASGKAAGVWPDDGLRKRALAVYCVPEH